MYTWTRGHFQTYNWSTAASWGYVSCFRLLLWCYSQQITTVATFKEGAYNASFIASESSEWFCTLQNTQERTQTCIYALTHICRHTHTCTHTHSTHTSACTHIHMHMHSYHTLYSYTLQWADICKTCTVCMHKYHPEIPLTAMLRPADLSLLSLTALTSDSNVRSTTGFFFRSSHTMTTKNNGNTLTQRKLANPSWRANT